MKKYYIVYDGSHPVRFEFKHLALKYMKENNLERNALIIQSVPATIQMFPSR